jgi:Fe2+ or Zn2+ uptake regulation protein
MSRESRQKQAILKVLRGANGHPPAAWIYDEVRKQIPNISLGTVYRNLKALCDAKEIIELDLAGDTRRYEGRLDKHHHFKCDSCGHILDVDESMGGRIVAQFTQKTGLQINDFSLIFTGLCRDCQRS